MTKTLLKERAVKLRREGFSYNFIREQVGVSKSTLNKWLSGVPFEPNNQFVEKVNRTHANLRDQRRKAKTESEKAARELAIQDVGSLSERDLFMLGLGIYMGEGSKSVGIRLVNSDPRVLKVGIAWLKRVYGLKDENFRVRIHLYPDCDIEESRRYWSEKLRVDINQFYPVHVGKKENRGIRNSEKLLFGTAHVTIRSYNKKEFGILLMRRILNSIEIVSGKAGLV